MTGYLVREEVEIGGKKLKRRLVKYAQSRYTNRFTQNFVFYNYIVKGFFLNEYRQF